MPSIKTLICLLFTTIILMSCDPIKVLVIKATDKENVSVTLYGNQKAISGDNKNKDNKIIIHVPYVDSTIKYQQVFAYGIGAWPKPDIEEFTANVDSIVINNSL